MPIRLEVVTAERVVFSGDADIIIAPGVEGQLGILPHHAPLMTMLQAGQLVVRKDGEEMLFAVGGGFLEVKPDVVIALADTAERADEIDVYRARAARERAEQRLKEGPSGVEMAQAQAALRRALARIDVAERRRRKTRAP